MIVVWPCHVGAIRIMVSTWSFCTFLMFLLSKKVGGGGGGGAHKGFSPINSIAWYPLLDWMDLVTLKHSFSDSGIKLSQAAVNFWSNHSVTDNLKKIFWFCLDSDESSLNPDELLVSDSVKFAWQILYCNWYASVPEKKISATLNISGFWATPSPFIFNYASAHMLPIWHVISFLFKNCGSPKWTASNSRNIDIFKVFCAVQSSSRSYTVGNNFPPCFGNICLGAHLEAGWINDLLEGTVILFIHQPSSSKTSGLNVTLLW